MVGYQHNDTLTSTQKLIAGCASGVITRFITQPLDVVKLREQLKTKEVRAADQKIWFKTTRTIFRDEGIMAFWQGHNLGQIHSIASVTCSFYIYEIATKAVVKSKINSLFKPPLVFMSGVLAGCCTALVVSPLEVIRVRQMLAKSQYKGIIRGAREVYSARGIAGFYEGVNASVLQMGSSIGVAFAVFNYVQPLVMAKFQNCKNGECQPGQYRPEHVLIASTIAGSASGFVSKSITYPFDLAKRRMQIGSYKAAHSSKPTSKNITKCVNLTQCLVNMYQEDGIRGMFRGWKITIYKAQITSIVSFTSYELVCYGIRKITM